MRSVRERFPADAVHSCTICGKVLPVAAFAKWRNDKYKQAWDCDVCRAARITAATRAYRADPEKRERDREVSRRWKRVHLGQPGRPRDAA